MMVPDDFEKLYPGCLPFQLGGSIGGRFWYVRLMVGPHLVIMGGAVDLEHLVDMTDEFWLRYHEDEHRRRLERHERG